MYCQQVISNNVFWGISSDTIFTTSITIFIFFIGLLAKQIYESRNEKQRLRQIRSYVLNVLKNVPQVLSGVSETMANLGEQIGDLSHQNIVFNENYKLYVDSIKTVKDVDFYNAIFVDDFADDKYAFKNYENILNTIEFIKSHKKRVKENFINYFNRYRTYSNDWAGKLNSIFRSADKFISFNEINGIPTTEDKFLNEFLTIVQNWRQLDGDNTHYLVVSEHLLDPLKKLCLDNFSDPRAIEVLPVIIDMKEILGNIQNVKSAFKDYFIQESKQLELMSSNLEKAVEYFSNPN